VVSNAPKAPEAVDSRGSLRSSLPLVVAVLASPGFFHGLAPFDVPPRRSVSRQ